MFQQSSIKLEKTRSNLLKQRAKNDEKQKKREKKQDDRLVASYPISYAIWLDGIATLHHCVFERTCVYRVVLAKYRSK